MADRKSEEATGPRAAPAEGEVIGKSCPICQTQIVRGELATACPACQLDYHSDCWKSNGGCGAYGCKWTPETVKAKVNEHTHWGGEKQCPSCRRMIRADLMECSSCDVQFWTRDPISREAWAGREYSGQELIKVRNAMILVFLASTVGCLFPLVAIFTGNWLWGSGGPYQLARLPASLKILLKASFAASILWGVVLILVLLTS
jgi:hypothetical protein